MTVIGMAADTSADTGTDGDIDVDVDVDVDIDTERRERPWWRPAIPTATPWTALLAAGDLVAVLGFVVVGEISHYSLEFVITNPAYVAGTAAPFLLAWIVIAPVVGLYDGRPRAPRRAAVRAGLAWVPAALLGQALRATSLFHGGTALAFVVVSVVVGAAMIGGWRGLATWGARQRRR